jgi:hypothetical protein
MGALIIMRYNMRMKRERRTPPAGPMVRCPRCRAKGENVYLIEFWKNSSVEFDQNADGTIEKEGVLREGDPYKVQANCGCGHRWTLRGITQIVNLPGHPDHKDFIK